MKMSDLYKAGKEWNARVWIEGNYVVRDQIIADLNAALGGLSIRIGHGWQQYDPVVRLGRPRNYVSIAADLDNDAQNNAALFIRFADDGCELSDLPRTLQELCVIVFFAETGRGYGSGLESELYPLVGDIRSGNDVWASLKTRYTPSLTYQEDNKDYILE